MKIIDTWISELKQLTREWTGKNEALDEVGFEPCASKSLRLDGSSGMCWRFWQWLKLRTCSLESWLMVAGMLLKSFDFRFSSFSDDKWQISLGIPPSIILQWLRSNTSNDDRQQISIGILLSFELILKLRISRAFRCSNNDDGSTFIAVPLKSSSLSFLILPLISGNLFSFEQPRQDKVWRYFHL